MLKVAVVQAAPVFLNLEASITRAIELIGEAASQGAKLIVFGETWVSGYPAWLDYCPDAALWNHEPAKEVFAQLRQNSLVIHSEHTQRLSRAVKDHGTILVIGVNERIEQGPGNGTLYNSLLIFDSDGSIKNHRRKLMPTYTERLVWGMGDGKALNAVDTSVGRLGGLICWEHWMPLARQALHDSGEDIHVAVWPTVNEMHQIASRHYAFEGRCFVIAAGSMLRVRDLPTQLEVSRDLRDKPEHLLLRGGSSIIAPNGDYVVEPLFDEEKIIIAEIDLKMIDRERMTLDVSGHYQRPDLFDFQMKT